LSTEQIPRAAERRFGTLAEWLAWLETLHPKKIDFSLNRIRAVLEALNIVPPGYRIVTVGGTNGKGSCVALLEQMYLAAGFAVGTFTSPHLVRFNERIRFNARDIDDETLMDLFERMDAARGELTLSYFEASAVAAMLHFARVRADVAILEVGMGGRLDAVNALDTDAALIVSVDLDHIEWLGPDREAIGREKVGIVRRGRPAIVADADPPVSVAAGIAARSADGRFIGRDFAVREDGDGLVYTAADREERRFPRPGFGGRFQLSNAAACIAVVDALGEILPVSDAAIAAGIAGTQLRGRIDRQRIAGVEWIFDVAHNPAAARLFAAALGELPAARTVAVFGLMHDKDLDAVVAPFIDTIEEWFVATLDSERTAEGSAVAQRLAELGAARVSLHADVAAATRAAAGAASERVLVFGSFYTVGPAMSELGLYC
jgi:dihydrofolate synthase/folylpolyglutamate synthase